MSVVNSSPIVGRLGGFVYRLFIRLVRDHWQLTEGIKRLKGSQLNHTVVYWFTGNTG